MSKKFVFYLLVFQLVYIKVSADDRIIFDLEEYRRTQKPTPEGTVQESEESTDFVDLEDVLKKQGDVNYLEEYTDPIEFLSDRQILTRLACASGYVYIPERRRCKLIYFRATSETTTTTQSSYWPWNWGK
jgi:hypothetical protein